MLCDSLQKTTEDGTTHRNNKNWINTVRTRSVRAGANRFEPEQTGSSRIEWTKANATMSPDSNARAREPNCLQIFSTLFIVCLILEIHKYTDNPYYCHLHVSFIRRLLSFRRAPKNPYCPQNKSCRADNVIIRPTGLSCRANNDIGRCKLYFEKNVCERARSAKRVSTNIH